MIAAAAKGLEAPAKADAFSRPKAAALVGNPFQRFAMTRPQFALASENKNSFMPTYRDVAIAMKYIQVGGMMKWQAYMVFDVDRSDAKRAWIQASLPVPTFCVTNRENGHAHYFWELAIPVSMLPVEAQTRTFRMIADAYTNRLNADVAFVGLCAKNPLSSHWEVSASNARYDLPALAKPLTKSDYARPLRSSGVGRNCDLFDWARTRFAYPMVREFESESDFAAGVLKYAIEQNRSAFVAPLTDKECAWIAKSISKWTWKRRDRFGADRKIVRRGAMGFDPLPAVMDADKRLTEIRERQRAAGPAAREAVKASTRARIASAVLSLVAEEKRVSAAAVARYTGLGLRTVMRHRDLLAGDGKVVALRPKPCHTVYSGVEGGAVSRPGSEGESK
jgi:hypothetical protein